MSSLPSTSGQRAVSAASELLITLGYVLTLGWRLVDGEAKSGTVQIRLCVLWPLCRSLIKHKTPQWCQLACAFHRTCGYFPPLCCTLVLGRCPLWHLFYEDNKNICCFTVTYFLCKSLNVNNVTNVIVLWIQKATFCLMTEPVYITKNTFHKEVVEFNSVEAASPRFARIHNIFFKKSIEMIYAPRMSPPRYNVKSIL